MQLSHCADLPSSGIDGQPCRRGERLPKASPPDHRQGSWPVQALFRVLAGFDLSAGFEAWQWLGLRKRRQSIKFIAGATRTTDRASMEHRGIDYMIRATLDPNEWTWMVYLPNGKTKQGNVKGVRARAEAAAKQAIDVWLRANKPTPTR
jgi:hypothetical protein